MEEKAILVPYDKIPDEALMGLMKSYVEREGTDYGATEISQSRKLERLKKALKEKHVYISYEESSESIQIISKDDAFHQGLLKKS